MGNGAGRYADKVLKVPAKRTTAVLRWLLEDFEANAEKAETFLAYYLRKEADYFYQNLTDIYGLKQLLYNEGLANYRGLPIIKSTGSSDLEYLKDIKL